jgi:predicted nucleic acid-binding protein
MSVGSRGPVVIDTGVFGARLTPSGRLLASRYRPVLEGRPAIISFVTVAELEYGARLAGWGPTDSGAWSTRSLGQRSCGQDRA